MSFWGARRSAAANEPPPTLAAVRARALRALAAREHTRSGLAQKLQPLLPDAAQLEALLDELQAKGYLSDERFAHNHVRQRAARQGSARLRQSLREQGVGQALVDEATKGLGASEEDRARALLHKKFGASPPSAAEAAPSGGEPAPPLRQARQAAQAAQQRWRQRQYRFLLGRGFAAEVVRKVVLGADAAAADEEAGG